MSRSGNAEIPPVINYACFETEGEKIKKIVIFKVAKYVLTLKM